MVICMYSYRLVWFVEGKKWVRDPKAKVLRLI